jgi:adenylate kinase family enzyme
MLNDKPYLILIGGPSGSGKSTLARTIINSYHPLPFYMFEADDYFSKNGKYNFDAKGLGQAHKECWNNVLHNLKSGCNTIVSNTFTTHKETEKYLNLRNYQVYYTFPNRIRNMDISDFCKSSIHKVPKETISKQYKRWLDYVNNNMDLSHYLIEEESLLEKLEKERDKYVESRNTVLHGEPESR